MLSGIIGKRVKFPCGTAAVMAEFRLFLMSLWIAMGRPSRNVDA